MAFRSIFLSALAATIIVNFCTSADIPDITNVVCTVEKITGEECTECNFLTFGQHEIIPGINVICPIISDPEEKYCCYGPSRIPFCCDQKIYFITGSMWIAAVIAIIGVVGKIIKCLIT